MAGCSTLPVVAHPNPLDARAIAGNGGGFGDGFPDPKRHAPAPCVACLFYTSPVPRDSGDATMPSSPVNKQYTHLRSNPAADRSCRRTCPRTSSCLRGSCLLLTPPGAFQPDTVHKQREAADVGPRRFVSAKPPPRSARAGPPRFFASRPAWLRGRPCPVAAERHFRLLRAGAKARRGSANA